MCEQVLRRGEFRCVFKRLRKVRSEGAGMKVLIAIVLIMLWLFLPYQPFAKLWRRWRAKREAKKYSQTLFK